MKYQKYQFEQKRKKSVITLQKLEKFSFGSRSFDFNTSSLEDPCDTFVGWSDLFSSQSFFLRPVDDDCGTPGDLESLLELGVYVGFSGLSKMSFMTTTGLFQSFRRN